MVNIKELIPVYTEDVIKERVAQMGAQIAADCSGEELVCVCVLKGAVFFFTDLVREIGRHHRGVMIDFLRASSYGSGMSSSSEVRITKDVDIDVKDRHVLFIEDVIDSGITMSKLIPMFKARGAKSVRLAALIDKRERREVEINIDYPGFVLDKGFIVGYGLDLAEKYRELTGIYEVIVD